MDMVLVVLVWLVVSIYTPQLEMTDEWLMLFWGSLGMIGDDYVMIAMGIAMVSIHEWWLLGIIILLNNSKIWFLHFRRQTWMVINQEPIWTNASAKVQLTTGTTAPLILGYNYICS